VLSFLTEHHAIKAYWRCRSTHSFPSALDGGDWSASRPGRSTRMERAPGTHQIGSWMGSTASLDAMVRRKFPAPTGTRTPDHPARSPALYHWANPAPKIVQHHAVKTYWRSGGIALRILNLDTRWRWVVSFTSRPLYPRYPVDRRLGGPQRRCGREGEEKRLFHYCPTPPGIEPR
jgi:hypothetical protein